MNQIMNGFERSENREKIKFMPGWDVHWTCVRLMQCYKIFYHNSEKLIYYASNPPKLHYYIMPDIKSRVQKNTLNCEAASLIHNYVASAKTLVDISTKNSRKWLTSELKNEYNHAVSKKFKNDACTQIILSLRNFMLHVDIPDISNQIDIFTGFSSSIALLPEKLLNWDNWNSVAKQYLKVLYDKGEKIIINEFFQKYTDKATSITTLLLKYIIDSNVEDLNKIYFLHDQIIEGVKEDGYVTDPLFVHFFSRNEQYAEDGSKIPIFVGEEFQTNL